MPPKLKGLDHLMFGFILILTGAYSYVFSRVLVRLVVESHKKVKKNKFGKNSFNS